MKDQEENATMRTKNSFLLQAISLWVLIALLLPAGAASALPAADPPPGDMFQLPWDLGKAWVALDGIDNGSKRPASSSHNHRLGGAIDFAPKSTMITGEDTSNFWVAAAAAGTVIQTASCYVTIAHSDGWLTQYQFLGNIQVQLGDVVARNQRLGIIADGVKYKYCPGFEEINVPHLHFILRPSIIGASFAGWEVKYSSLFNRTTFTKGLITVGLFKPLLNVLDATPTPTPTTQLTNTPGITPSSTPTPEMSATPTIVGPYVSTTVDPASFEVGETALATVSLNNVPSSGYVSAEFTCQYDPSLLEVSNIAVANLFGTDAAVAINGPENGKLILAIAGSNGNKATTSGSVFTFSVTGLQPGQMYFGCEARVSEGSNGLAQLPSARAYVIVLGSTPTAPSSPTPYLTPPTPTVLPSTCDRAEFIAHVTVPPGTVMLPAAAFTKTWRLKNLGPCVWTTSYRLVYFAGEQMGAPSASFLPQSVAVGETIDISLNMIAPNVAGSHQGYWMFMNASGQNFGTGPEANQPWLVDITVSGPTLPPSLTPTFPPPSETPGPTSTPSPDPSTPTVTESGPFNSPTPTPPSGGATDTPSPAPTIPSDWLTFLNSTYSFQFRYPSGSQIVAGGTDNSTRINLPFVPGTNLSEKYLQMTVIENANPCQSPLSATSPPGSPTETVVINGISFLKQVGGDAGAGHLHEWVGYSTLKNNACISMDFVLHSLNPGNYATPPPVFDKVAESAVFGQIVSTFEWLGVPTATATQTATLPSTPAGSLTPTTTATPAFEGAVNGQVLAGKPVTVSLYDGSDTLVASVTANPDGTFSLNASAGTYTIRATASGFLRAQGPVTITAGNGTTKATITLLAGDIDGNDVIDQFDAMTIGMNYNAATPSAADLNNDGVINVLDLELLAGNYREMGPLAWP
jgi:murein DD-endopeptidase MepM/ murein hydrolase activator NlpD